MQTRFFLPTTIVALLLIPHSVWAQGGAPSGSAMASAAAQRQAQFFKVKYGFSDAQVAKHQANETRIYSDWQKNLTAMQKQAAATKDREQKRVLMGKMRDSIKTRDGKVQQSLRAVATPAQRAKM